MSASRVFVGSSFLAAFLVPALAGAHFVLQTPPATFEQDDFGDPQKAPPCGDQGQSVPTDIVTPYQAGDTLTITLEEAVYHPGHYRIALVADIADLPPEPPVTPGDTPCGSAPIDPDPQFPVLADGVFEHDSPMAGPQTIEVTIPADLECDNCTLQIIQFMSNHALNNPGGCYYHHCATISVSAEPVTTSGEDDTGPSATEDDGDGSAGPVTTDAPDDDGTPADDDGTPADDDGTPADGDGTPGSGSESAGVETDSQQSDDDTDGGCGCTQGRAGNTAAFALFAVGLAAVRTRRRRVA
jgi:MYXO-CTERM domain-containing protein